MMAESDPNDVPQFIYLKQIGEGGYGTIHLVEHSKWGKVVLKKLRDSNSIVEDVKKSLRHEAGILSKLQHMNVVVLLESRFDSRCCGLFLEYVKYGPVDDFLKQFDVNTAWKIQTLMGIVLAMCYLHKEKIVHGDLKCKNILIGKHFQVKICDFGFAKIYKLSNSKATEASTLKGTLAYIAPEYFLKPKMAKTKKFDVYSFAISAWEIFYEKPAYHDVTVKEILSVFVERGTRPEMAENDNVMPEQLKKVIVVCWHGNEEERPDFECIKDSVILIQSGELHPSLASTRRIVPSNDEPIRRKIKDRLLFLQGELIKMDPLAISKSSGDFKRHTKSADEADKITHDSRERNLMDILYDEDCISVIDKKNIEMLNSTDTKNEALLKLMMDGCMETYEIFMRFLTETNQISRIMMKGEFKEIRTAREERGRGSVFAITWMRGKIYVVWQRSNVISVYQQDGLSGKPLKIEEIDNPEFGQPWDMTSSEEEGCLFISDPDEKCIWKIQTRDTHRDMTISNYETDGRPKGLSFRSNVLVALVQKDNRWYLNRYQANTMVGLSSINLQTEISINLQTEISISRAEHAVQTSTGNIIILYKSWTLTDSNERRNVHFISEMKIEGNSIKKVYPPMITSFWISALHLAIDENDNVLIADTDHRRIVLLDPQLEWGVDIINDDKTGKPVVPRRLCYVQQQKILLVAHGMDLSGLFSIYSLN